MKAISGYTLKIKSGQWVVSINELKYNSRQQTFIIPYKSLAGGYEPGGERNWEIPFIITVSNPASLTEVLFTMNQQNISVQNDIINPLDNEDDTLIVEYEAYHNDTQYKLLVDITIGVNNL